MLKLAGCRGIEWGGAEEGGEVARGRDENGVGDGREAEFCQDDIGAAREEVC